MKIKRFFAPDMRRAIALVRSEHGSDAVILSSRMVDGGIEIVSAVDYDQRLVREIAGQARSGADGGTDGAGSAGIVDAAGAPAAAPAAPAPAIEWSLDPTLQAMQRELAAMKQMLKEQFAHLAWADMKTFDPERALLHRRIAALGFESALADALVEEAFAPGQPPDRWRSVLRGIVRRISVLEEDPVEAGGVIALVGPTGVGKTTTIAKLAARHCLRYGPDAMALISTDTYRVGAQRQLEVFGAILGVPVRRADSPAALATLLNEQRHRRLVLIDTAGLAPGDCRVAESIGTLHDIARLRTFLVLPANMQASVMRDAVCAFGGNGLAGVALTKLDESNGLGVAISVLVESGLPVAWLSEGQRVPEDLKIARAMHMVGWAANPPDIDNPAPPRAPAFASLSREAADVAA